MSGKTNHRSADASHSEAREGSTRALSDHALREQFEHLQREYAVLSQRMAAIVSDREHDRATRRAALNLMEDAILAREAAQHENEQRRQAEHDMRASENKYRNLFISIDEGLCVIEVLFDDQCRAYDYRFLETNPAFEKHSGLHAVCGKTIRELLPNYDQQWIEIFGSVALTGQPVRQESFSPALGRWLDVYAFPTGPIGGHKVGVLFRDVTERKLAEEALREADRRKDEFLATLAHELRNPFAPLRSGLQTLKLVQGNVRVFDEVCGMMERQVAQMIRLIDDLLDVSRISRGKINLRPELVDLRRVINEAVEISRPLIEARDHELTIDQPREAIVVEADVTRLEQVVANLLNNAAKYTQPGGKISLSAQREGSQAVVRVRDTGVGIPPHMLQSVFEMFTQIDTSLEQSRGGLGIGLSLVKKLVEMHGGTVAAHSDGLGAGSMFVVRMPVAETSSAEAVAHQNGAAPAAKVRRRILVVDDNRTAALSLTMIFNLMGHETQAAFDGAEALAVAAEFRPDVMLLDIGMPNLDGLETCRRLRAQSWGRDVTVLALSGWGQAEDKQRSLDAGFDAHLVKPVDPAALDQMFSELHHELATQ